MKVSRKTQMQMRPKLMHLLPPMEREETPSIEFLSLSRCQDNLKDVEADLQKGKKLNTARQNHNQSGVVQASENEQVYQGGLSDRNYKDHHYYTSSDDQLMTMPGGTTYRSQRGPILPKTKKSKKAKKKKMELRQYLKKSLDMYERGAGSKQRMTYTMSTVNED